MINKLYMCAALAAIVGLIYWRYDYVMSQNEQLSADLANEKQLHHAAVALLEKERQNAAQEALRAQRYFEKRAKDDEELEKLRACHADKSCWPVVRIKTSCPAVPGAASNAGASEESPAELGEDAARTLLRLRSEIKEITTGYIALQQELIARSDLGYCKP